MNRLLIVTALMSEAVPLIDFYRMQKQPKRKHYHLYTAASEHATLRLELLVGGLGAENMRKGLAAYFNHCNSYDKNIYLNIGIAGALHVPVGRLLWAGSVADTCINIPQGVRQTAVYAVHSLPVASTQYLPGVLFDMEAESWLKSISENSHPFAPTELFCAKVVSDNQRQHGHKIDKIWVTDCVRQNIVELDESINKLIKSLK